MIDLMGKRYYFFAFSLLIIIPGIILMFVWGLPFSIDFEGGSLVEVQFNSGKAPQPAEVVKLYESMNIASVQVSTAGADSLMIRSAVLDDTARAQVISEMEQKFNDKITVNRFDNVGPTVGKEVTSRASLAVLLSSLALVIFITFAFRGIKNALHYGICTVIALIHDVMIILSIAVIGGRFWNWQIDTLFLTALLTVIAFSAQDTIVVFDRIRENSYTLRKLDIEKVTNHSVLQTLTRSINTQLMTVDFMLLALALFGGVTLREFATALLVGMISGSYSSDFVAAPLLIVWEKQEWKTWFHRNQPAAA